MEAIVVIIICYGVYLLSMKIPITCEYYSDTVFETITTKAHRDLTVIGDYGLKYKTSLKFLLIEVYVRLHVQYGCTLEDIRANLIKWARKGLDPKLITEMCIDEVYNDLFEEQRKAKEEKRDPVYHVDLSLPIPCPSKVLRCNDYCDVNELIRIFTTLASGGIISETE